MLKAKQFGPIKSQKLKTYGTCSLFCYYVLNHPEVETSICGNYIYKKLLCLWTKAYFYSLLQKSSYLYSQTKVIQETQDLLKSWSSCSYKCTNVPLHAMIIFCFAGPVPKVVQTAEGFRAPPAYAAQLLTLYQHRANKQVQNGNSNVADFKGQQQNSNNT